MTWTESIVEKKLEIVRKGEMRVKTEEEARWEDEEGGRQISLTTAPPT